MFSATTDLTDAQFEKVQNLVYRECGIHLKSGKEALVRARLTKRLRALRMKSFGEYLAYLENEGKGMELSCMIDVITTNKTSFFREIDHFHFLREKVLPNLTNRRIRFWSAGCSSGEEPFSLAMLLLDAMPDIGSKDALILATDISTSMLKTDPGRHLFGGKTYGASKIFFKQVFCQNVDTGRSNLSSWSSCQKNGSARFIELDGILAHERPF